MSQRVPLLPRLVRVLPMLLALLLLASPATHAASGPEKSVVLQFTPGSQTGHGFELARARVYYRFSHQDKHIVVHFRFDRDSLDTNGVYYFEGKHYAVRDPDPKNYYSLKVQGMGVHGGSVGTFSGAAPASSSFVGSLANRLDRLDAHLPPRPSGERYPRAYVEQFLGTLSAVLDLHPPLTSQTADEQVKRQLREAEHAERMAQKAKEREEREAQQAKEMAAREAQAAREKAAREAQREQEQTQRLARQQQAQREQQKQRESAGARTGPAPAGAGSSSGPLTREQRQAEADAKYQAYVNNFQAEKQRKAEARAAAQRRQEEETAAEQQRAREAFAAQQEQQRLDAVEREAQVQQLAESTAPLVAAGLEALDEVFGGLDSGLPDFREVSLGCGLSTGVTPGCTVNLRVGAFFYLTMGGGYSSAPSMQSTVSRTTFGSSSVQRTSAEASVSSWFAELGAGLHFPIDDDWRVMVEVAPFLGAGKVTPPDGFSEEHGMTLFGLSASASGWYRIPSTEYRVGLQYRLQSVGLGFGAEEGEKDLLASEQQYQSGGTVTRELRKDEDQGGMYSSLGISFALPF